MVLADSLGSCKTDCLHIIICNESKSLLENLTWFVVSGREMKMVRSKRVIKMFNVDLFSYFYDLFFIFLLLTVIMNLGQMCGAGDRELIT